MSIHPIEPNSSEPLVDVQNQVIGFFTENFPVIPDLSCTDRDIDLSLEENWPAPKQDQGPIEVRCICKLKHCDEAMIKCDSCGYWLHINCVRLDNAGEIKPFVCLYCQYKVSSTVRSYIMIQTKKYLDFVNEQAKRKQDPSKHYTPTILAMVKELKNSIQVIPEFLPKTIITKKKESETEVIDKDPKTKGTRIGVGKKKKQ